MAWREPVLGMDFHGALPPGEAFPLEILCVAPHPDDAELGMGGALALHADLGRRAGVVDLSGGDMASNGTPAERLAEGAAAAEVLGLCWRGNLGIPDRALHGPEAEARLAAVIRWTRPALLFVPCPEDPHPDHRAAYHLCLEAVFSAGLRRYPASVQGGPPAAAFRPRAVLQYFINGWREPPLALDVSGVYARKRRAVAAHASQFGGGPVGPEAAGAVPTRLNQGQAVAQVEARDRFLGARLGAAFAEGFIPEGTLHLADFGFVGGASG